MSRLRSLCTKNQGKRGQKNVQVKVMDFFVFASPLFIHKKDGKLFSFSFFCTVLFFFCKQELKTNFLTPRQSRCSRGRKSCENKVFRFRVVCVPLSCWLHSPSTCRYFPFRRFSLPSTLLHLRKKFLFRPTNREHSRSHSRAAQRKLKILAPDASECAFYLLNCYFFGTLLLALRENVYNRD